MHGSRKQPFALVNRLPESWNAKAAHDLLPANQGGWRSIASGARKLKPAEYDGN
jgi:hypothetical protein